jgi:perosamine synthetase
MNDRLHEDTTRLWLDPERTFGFHRGRVALHVLLEAAGIGSGDEVLIPGFTCFAVAAAVLYTGATPVFYDIAPGTYNGCETSALARWTARTRAVVVQHTFGVPAPMDRILAAARQRDARVIEDCAHALGAGIGARPVGSFGDAAFCSLQWSKPLALGLGGIARVNDRALATRVSELYLDRCRPCSPREELALDLAAKAHARLFAPRLYWRARSAYHLLARTGLLTGSSGRQELRDPCTPTGYHRTLGPRRRARLPELLGQIGSMALHRRRIAAVYRQALSTGDPYLPPVPDGCISLDLRVPLLVRQRERVLAEARAARIELGDWFNAPLHPADVDAAAFGYREGTCPVSEGVAAHVINLPTHGRVSRAEAERILAFVKTRSHLWVPLDDERAAPAAKTLRT